MAPPVTPKGAVLGDEGGLGGEGGAAEADADAANRRHYSVRVHTIQGNQIQQISEERDDEIFTLTRPDDGDGAVTEGDILYLPELIVGRGDFEGVFFAGAPSPDGTIPMRTVLEEHLVFPNETMELMKQRGSTVLKHYRKAIDHVCQDIGFFLDDFYGGPNELISEWEDPCTAPADSSPRVVALNLKGCTRKVVLEYVVDE